MTQTIVLTGFMGSGKSSVARVVARRLKWPLRDLDALIEEHAAMPISQLFATRGEDEFRRLEALALRDVLQQAGVLATGGGIVTRAENRVLLKNAAPDCHVIYLRARAETLAARIRRQPGKRPLIDGGAILNRTQTEARVREILQVREAWYEQCATHVIDADNRSVAQIVTEIIQLVP